MCVTFSNTATEDHDAQAGARPWQQLLAITRCPPAWRERVGELAHLEHNLHVVHLVLVPARAHEGLVEEAEYDQVLSDLLAQIVVDPINLRITKLA